MCLAPHSDAGEAQKTTASRTRVKRSTTVLPREFICLKEVSISHMLDQVWFSSKYMYIWYQLFIYYCHLLITFANSLDPDQARLNGGPDLDPNCFTHWWYSRNIFFLKKLILKKQQTAKTLPSRQRIKMKWHITNLLPEIMISKNRHFKTQNYRWNSINLLSTYKHKNSYKYNIYTS